MRTLTSLRCVSFAFLLFFLCSPVAWSQAAPSIALTMTLMADTNGTPGDECGTLSTLTVGAGTDVEVCYSVTNTGLTTLDLHDLVDSELGAILTGFAYSLVPDATVFLTQTVTASVDTTFAGTWTAYNAGPTDVATSSNSATLTVIPPSIALTMTLMADTNGTPGDECGTLSTLTVGAGTDVEVCYSVTNTGLTTLDLHDLVDSELGAILTGFAYSLVPDATVFLTQTVTASVDTTFAGTWTAYNAGPTDVATSEATAYLQVAAVTPVPVPALSPFALVLLAGLLALVGGLYWGQSKGTE